MHRSAFPDHVRIRSRFLDRHPKASLYADFGDFRFMRITPRQASLNGGFGHAYRLPGSDLVIPHAGMTPEWLELQENLKNMTSEAQIFAGHLRNDSEKPWRFGGVDKAGIDLISGDFQLRHEFSAQIEVPGTVLDYIFGITKVHLYAT